MPEARRATLKDVAAASGVSRATVSFVLNDTPNQTISEATRARVLQAVHDLGYVPHGIAKALREGTSRLIVLFLEHGLEGNYSRSFIRGLDDELGAHDHVLLVRHGQVTETSEKQIIDVVRPRAALRFGEPGRGDGPAAHAAQQIGYLAGRGHTRIAMAVPADARLREVRLRFAGEAAAELGLPPLLPLTGLSALRELVADGITAIAGHDDDIAMRTMAAARDQGLSVPGDLAVMGFDDTAYGAMLTPSLTTVHIDAEAHGRLTARTLLGMSTDGLAPAPAQVIVRESA
ncbi:LacI family DNA-binding transcriptional regulator [Paractinoplanes atraurantiacus]|uniref:DNA-binding transcriptional regulator, LacI/PurR family n=1 Tax=Paractinoplanes atraurantiacus TaxID=1036182 RepID=A0A285K6B2_9ACTN|nr:LacI family DNA-binding transcriptional regulator [Actinoplanes atraurantiacus]SNY67547.1 DNA-binding transcriptional regulator, LacI/PurR family [Actinoplanes atraurantiacus]